MKEPPKNSLAKHPAKRKGYQTSRKKATRLNWPTAKASGTVQLKKELHKKANIQYFPEQSDS